jgi:hypothetical protein
MYFQSKNIFKNNLIIVNKHLIKVHVICFPTVRVLKIQQVESELLLKIRAPNKKVYNCVPYPSRGCSAHNECASIHKPMPQTVCFEMVVRDVSKNQRKGDDAGKYIQ